MLLQSYRRLWGWWPVGYDTVHWDERKRVVVVSQSRTMAVWERVRRWELEPDAIQSIRTKQTHLGYATGVTFNLIAACLVGFWGHLIPCLWWQCNSGSYDAEGLRYFIWGVLWGGGFLYLCSSRAHPAILEMHVREAERHSDEVEVAVPCCDAIMRGRRRRQQREGPYVALDDIAGGGEEDAQLPRYHQVAITLWLALGTCKRFVSLQADLYLAY